MQRWRLETDKVSGLSCQHDSGGYWLWHEGDQTAYHSKEEASPHVPSGLGAVATLGKAVTRKRLVPPAHPVITTRRLQAYR